MQRRIPNGDLYPNIARGHRLEQPLSPLPDNRRSCENAVPAAVYAPNGRTFSPSAATVAASWNTSGVTPPVAVPTRNALCCTPL